MVVPIFMVKSFCFDIIQEVEKAISGSHLHSTLAQNIDTLKMLEYDTTAQLFHILRLSCKQICDAVKNGILQDNNTKAMQMIHYIEQNSSDPSFSTEKMAEYFSMSSTALCQYFKNHTGQTITDYLVDFRIKVAKNLLKATDYSINQISFNAGYYNVSSFIRRFKQITGYAPGTWRELHRNNAVNNE